MADLPARAPKTEGPEATCSQQKPAARYNQEKEFYCEVCGKRWLTTKYSFEYHVARHSPPSVKCLECDKMFYLPLIMKTHMKNMHVEDSKKPFPCTICPKAFNFKAKLEQHMNIHLGRKPYECDICGKGFAHSGNCQAHRRKVHKNE